MTVVYSQGLEPLFWSNLLVYKMGRQSHGEDFSEIHSGQPSLSYQTKTARGRAGSPEFVNQQLRVMSAQAGVGAKALIPAVTVGHTLEPSQQV